MVRTLALVTALALVGSAAAVAVASTPTPTPVKFTSGKFSAKLAALEAASNKTGAVKAEAMEMVENKLNHTMKMADKVFEFKNITDKALNLSKFEGIVDDKMTEIVDALNVTAAKIADVKEGVEAKIEEPVKEVDDKIDMLRMELEEKLMMLKNKTVGMKMLEFPKM